MPPRTTARKSSARRDVLSDVRLTSPNRVLYAEQGITKLDLAKYYVAVADAILPQIAGRPLSLVRCPAGIGGDCFFQKHPPTGLSDDVHRLQVREKSGSATYLVVEDLRGVLALVQFGALELHVWGAPADDVESPDRLVFDLDPGPGVSWKEVASAAAAVRDVLADKKLKSFLKTSGGKGLHVVAPLGGSTNWKEMKRFAKSIAVRLARDEPERFVDVMSKAARKGKIFIDYLRNERGATTVVAYSTRARPGAPVSLPVAWSQLGRLRSGDQFNVVDVPKLVARRTDPWKAMARSRQRLPAIDDS